MEYTTLAAVDLGSNSFHLAIGRVVDEQIYPLDSLKETVRLGGGLTADKRLDDDAQARALVALRQFAERIRGMPREAVRAVGTNALRVARNTGEFRKAAEKALGFPIEVISGREEGRLIYLGVVHSLPMNGQNRLVVDIGGGSTEFIIGNKLRTKLVESLYMGCVSYTQRFFPDGRIDKKTLKQAELAARQQVQAMAARFEKEGWKEAVGSSGTTRAIADTVRTAGQGESGITAAGLDFLREELLKAGDVRKLALPGLREDRVPVFAGGVAIMSGIFAELGLAEMTVAEGALRQGVLWDLLGRVHHRDIREVTVDQYERRYHVDLAQSQRVRLFARALLKQIDSGKEERAFRNETFLDWAARLHEIGMSISQAGYHKHSAYILANADMPGFSREEQGWLSNLVLSQRGKLAKMQAAFNDDGELATLAFCLRLAVIVYRSRRSTKLPKLKVARKGREFHLELDGKWLSDNTLVALALESERDEWDSTGLILVVSET